MKTLLLFLFICFLSNYSDAETDIKSLYHDYKYLSTTNEYYKYQSARNWADAVQICDSEGGSLWYPQNRIEADMVITWFNQSQSFDLLYVGISDIDVSGTYKTIDGKPIGSVYHIWKVGQPDNAENIEDCIQISTSLTLNDIDCGRQYPFICKKTKTIMGDDKNNCVISNSDGYVYLSTKYEYYKFQSPNIWTNALQICESETGSLWYPKNRDEASAVISLFSQIRNDDLVYVGISDRDVEGTYKTIDGQPISYVYHIWTNGQPDNAEDIEDCVQINTRLTLNDIDCNRQYPFICKKTKTVMGNNKNQCN